LRAQYAGAALADCRVDDVAMVQGWQIARTQAELCVLAYFSSAGLL
jgi:hypothetical protein